MIPDMKTTSHGKPPAGLGADKKLAKGPIMAVNYYHFRRSLHFDWVDLSCLSEISHVIRREKLALPINNHVETGQLGKAE